MFFLSQILGLMFIVPELRRPKGDFKFKASLGHIVSVRPVWTVQWESLKIPNNTWLNYHSPLICALQYLLLWVLAVLPSAARSVLQLFTPSPGCRALHAWVMPSYLLCAYDILAIRHNSIWVNFHICFIPPPSLSLTFFPPCFLDNVEYIHFIYCSLIDLFQVPDVPAGKPFHSQCFLTHMKHSAHLWCQNAWRWLFTS